MRWRGKRTNIALEGDLRCLCRGHQAMMQLYCHTLRWCEGLTQQLVADAGSIGNDRHKLNVSICQLGKVEEELRGTDAQTSVSSALLWCIP